jgi:hypothetical protein
MWTAGGIAQGLQIAGVRQLINVKTSASVSAIKCRHTADSIKPAPPVTIKRIKM